MHYTSQCYSCRVYSCIQSDYAVTMTCYVLAQISLQWSLLCKGKRFQIRKLEEILYFCVLDIFRINCRVFEWSSLMYPYFLYKVYYDAKSKCKKEGLNLRFLRIWWHLLHFCMLSKRDAWLPILLFTLDYKNLFDHHEWLQHLFVTTK